MLLSTSSNAQDGPTAKKWLAQNVPTLSQGEFERGSEGCVGVYLMEKRGKGIPGRKNSLHQGKEAGKGQGMFREQE